MEIFDVTIIGGGASGMTCAITIKQNRPELSVAVIEKLERNGSKLSATGNGRCNLSNVNSREYFRGIKFLKSVGVMTRDDGTGRLYPYSEDANAVAQLLERNMERLGVKTFCGERVSGVDRNEMGFTIECESDKKFKCEAVLLATGGKSGPKLGTTGDGYVIARTLGHDVTTLVPSLTPVVTKEDTAPFAGVRAKALITLCYKGFPIASESGEVQFTKNGVSGICIFNLSRYMTELPLSVYSLHLNFLPEVADVNSLLIERCRNMGDEDALLTLIKEPLSKWIIDSAKGDYNRILELLTDFRLTVDNLGGWKLAQVTRGGVSLREIVQETMESTVVPGLYLAGEVIDYDGPCGGFNLNHAWLTGLIAGEAIAKRKYRNKSSLEHKVKKYAK